MLNLDDLDMKIIKELGGSRPPLWNLRESYSNISRKLGVDEETVRLRINRAREHGFIPAWRLMLNPLLIGCKEAHLDVEVLDEGRKQEAIAKIKDVEGVYYIDDFRGKELAIGMYHESEVALAKRVEFIESICGSKKLEQWSSPFLKPDVQMKQLDWKIVDAMHEDAWRDIEEVAKALSVSSRSVQRRLSAMKEGKAIYLARPPDVSVVGGLMCNFLVFCPDPEKKRAADYQIHSRFSRIGASDTTPDKFSIIGMSCENFSEADKVLEKLRAIDGVESVRMRVVKEIVVLQDWLRKQVASRISSMQRLLPKQI